jgi:hypothetical protein
MRMMSRKMSVMTGLAAGLVLSSYMTNKNMKMIKRAWNKMM